MQAINNKHYPEGCILAIKLNVIMLSAVVLSVVAPHTKA